MVERQIRGCERTLFNSLTKISPSLLALKRLKTCLTSLIRMGWKKGYMEFEELPLDNFDSMNLAAMLEMWEHIVREKWIQIKKTMIIKEKLQWCYHVEGVNHL
ncbi:NADH dehydrogenase of ubiquinone 1 beta subcomplex subunit [Spatholobus suberectus]|nr:NADH dehydrogenase of ubiquinone 1 beta subcomplex subunit [Spatholobus suberectus]